ncbi:hypothetical protein [Streptomyces sp. NPDC097610]|uniref:hypothetical protein n=1 Tax=Streptomyces sp. NPDC097610 TaxID=3157227 RepID=UPI0033224C1D
MVPIARKHPPWKVVPERRGERYEPACPGGRVEERHADLPRALFEIGEDRDNRVLVLTGAGDRRVTQRLADLEMPLVTAGIGPAFVRSEYALLADLVVAADATVFCDFPP